MNNELRFGARVTPAQAARAIVACGRIIYARGLTSSNDGNISMRLGRDRVLVTPSGLSKGRLSADDLLIVSLATGQVVRRAADKALQPSGELAMHLEAYRQRPDIRAVLHAHPPYTVALTVSGRSIRNDLVMEAILGLGEIPVTDIALPISIENADVIREPIKTHDAVVIRQHGSLTVGRDLDACLIALERLESVAQVQWLAETLGQPRPLAPEFQTRLWELRKGLSA